MRWLHGLGDFTPEMLSEQPAREVMEETYRVLASVLELGVKDNVIPPAMAAKLDGSLFLFSGFKTAQELKEASLMLRDPDGSVKPFSRFLTEVRKIDEEYNVNYLEAEYNFAVSSSQMAAQWADMEENAGEYDLQYRTAEDDHVREEHEALHGITLPSDDPFWNFYFPPNGWGCRCNTVQVRRDKYPSSDSRKAMTAGDAATSQPRQKIFRFNPGKDGQLFPPHHPYYKLSAGDADIVKKVVEQVADQVKHLELDKIITGSRVTEQHIKDIMAEYARIFPEDYNGGLIEVKFSRSSSAFMSNGRYMVGPSGNILTVHNYSFNLREGSYNPAKELKGALKAIKEGKSLTFNQEYTIESLWHETLHAKARGWVNRSLRTSQTVMQMETINQFVARHSYTDFIGRLGGAAAHRQEVVERGYGYSNYINNFRNMLDHFGVSEEKTFQALKDKLITEPYENIGSIAADYLKGEGIEKASLYMSGLAKSEDTFKQLLTLDL